LSEIFDQLKKDPTKGAFGA